MHTTVMRIGLLIALSLLPLSSLSMASAQEAERPNLIFIMCDDLGWGDLGCYGQKTIQTPHVDRLAAEGLRFVNFYAGTTVCRPSRLVLWTGLDSGNAAISTNAGYHFKPEDVTVAELARDAGYATGGAGKWAMGGADTTGHPNANGFDFWFGYLDQGQAHNYYPTHLWRNRERVPLVGNVLSDAPGSRGRVASKRVTYAHGVMTDEALGFIRKHRERPFLLHVHWTIPHANNEGGRVTGDGMEVPMLPAKPGNDSSKPRADYDIYAERDWKSTAKGAAAMISLMDRDVGRIVALLKELGIEKRTLVLFTSDNGPHSEGGHKHDRFDSNGPLRGHKRDLYEGGIRVPGIAWWPGTIAPGRVTQHHAAFQDWLPTVCELAGVDAPKRTDGISFAPLLRGEKQRSHALLRFKFGAKLAVRKGRWKAVRPGKGKPVELYDLDADIGETRDLAGALEHAKTLKELRRALEALDG